MLLCGCWASCQASEAFNHILQRLRAATHVKLPVRALLELRRTAPSLSLSFIAVFVGVGLERCTAEEKDAVAPLLLDNVAALPASHRATSLRLLLKVCDPCVRVHRGALVLHLNPHRVLVARALPVSTTEPGLCNRSRRGR